MSVLTPNMSLIQSTIGMDTGLSWEQNLNSSLNVLDGHNHAPGSGLQINPNGLNINADLPFNNNNSTLLRSVRFYPQLSLISAASPDLGCLFEYNNELYYNDGAGNQVQITLGGAVNATSSGISSGSASASFVSSILTVVQSPGVGAAIDAASYILRYNGSYPSPSGNYIVLAAPSSLSGGYQITFPGIAPASSGALLTESIAGVLSYTHVDNSTLTISGGIMQVPAGGITATQIAANTLAVGNLTSYTTPGTYTFTTKADVTEIIVSGRGGSGQGGGGAGNNTPGAEGGGGGGGGAESRTFVIPVTASTAYTVVVGAGGTTGGGSGLTGTDGQDGVTSSFGTGGTALHFKAGLGGKGGNNSIAGGGVGRMANGGNGGLTGNGSPGNNTATANGGAAGSAAGGATSGGGGGGGGDGDGGAGGTPGVNGGRGVDGKNGGGGGGGAGDVSGSGGSAGFGIDGYVNIYYVSAF